MIQWKRSASAALLAISLAMTPTMAQAQVTQYTDFAQFLAAVTNPGTDTYAAFNTLGTTPTPISRTAGVYEYTAAAANNFYGAGTIGNPSLSTNTATNPITFSGFSSSVRGIGGLFYGSDINGDFQSGDIRIDWTEVGGATGFTTISNATMSSFFGVTSAGGGFTSFVVSSVQPSPTTFLWPTVDNFTLGAAGSTSVVPEPQSFALVGAGLLAVLFVRRRRQA